MKMNKITTLLFVPLLLLCGCTADDDYTQGVWKEKSDFDGLARGYACSFTIGDMGYVCCGYTGKKYLKDIWIYNVEKDYWTQGADMPDAAPARMKAMAFAVNGKGYVLTGSIKESPYYLSDTWEYNPDTNAWTQKDDYKDGARMGGLAFAINGYGYAGMGYNDNYLKDVYRFDPSAASGSQWTIVSGYGGSKRRFGSVFVINDEAYICCGENNGTYVDDFWKFNGTTWTQLRDIANNDDDNDYDDDYNIVRYSAPAFVIDGKGYLVGGAQGSMLSDYWIYDPSTDLWYGDSDDNYTTFQGSTRLGAVSISTGTRGFVVTGMSGSSDAFDDTWELLPYEKDYDD